MLPHVVGHFLSRGKDSHGADPRMKEGAGPWEPRANGYELAYSLGYPRAARRLISLGPSGMGVGVLQPAMPIKVDSVGSGLGVNQAIGRGPTRRVNDWEDFMRPS